MIPLQVRLHMFFRDIWHGVLGIFAELILVALLMVAGLMVCILWWGLFR
jgi:hypothetical protein